jgi:hypothetical protein
MFRFTTTQKHLPQNVHFQTNFDVPERALKVSQVQNC